MRRRKMAEEREGTDTEEAGREGERVEMVAIAPGGGRVRGQRRGGSK